MSNKMFLCLWWVKVYSTVSWVGSSSPVQSKGVVELDMWVSHGVKGWKLLQSFNQLHDGLVILNGK